MYRRKLAARALTAIATGALLVSNVTAVSATAQNAANFASVDEQKTSSEEEVSSEEKTEEEPVEETELPKESEEEPTEESTEVSEEETEVTEEETTEASEEETEESSEEETTEAADETEESTEAEETTAAQEQAPKRQMMMAAPKKSEERVSVKVRFVDGKGKDLQTAASIDLWNPEDETEFENIIKTYLGESYINSFDDVQYNYPTKGKDGKYTASVVLKKTEEKPAERVGVTVRFVDEEGKDLQTAASIDLWNPEDETEFENAVKAYLTEDYINSFDDVQYEYPTKGKDGKYTASVVLKKTEEKPAERVGVTVRFVDEEGKDLQTAASIDLWNPEDETEFENAVKAYLTEDYINSFDDVQYNYPTKGEDGKYTASVVLKKAAQRVGVTVRFVDEEGKDVQAAASFELWNPEDKAEFEKAVQGYFGDDASAYDFEYTYPTKGEDGKYTASVVLKKAAERVGVTVRFVDEEGKDVQAAASFELWNPEDKAEFEKAVNAYFGDDASAYDFEYTYPTKGEDGKYTASVVLKKAAQRIGVTVRFVDEEGKDVQAAASFELWNPEDKAEFEKAVQGYFGDDASAYDFEYTYPTKGEDGKYTASVVLKKAAERVGVTVRFVDEEGKDVQAAASFELWNPEDKAEFEKAVNAYFGDDASAYDFEYTYPTKGEDGKYTASVVLKKAAQRVGVTVRFVDEEGKDVQAAASFELWNPEDKAEFEKAVQGYFGDNASAYDFEYTYPTKGEDGKYTASVVLKKATEPEVGNAKSTITIEFKDGNDVKATQTITVEGKKGTTFKVTSVDVDKSKIPSGYTATYFADTTYHFGENGTLTVVLKKESSNNGGNNNGGGSSSGGSGGGGGTRVGAAFGTSGTLTNGSWHMLDDMRWEFNFTDGTKARNGWYVLSWQDRDDWYYFDADGYLVSGWYTDANGVKYYLHAQHDGTFGKMYTGWNKVDGTWQHFNDNTEQGVYGAWEQGAPVPAELANK